LRNRASLTLLFVSLLLLVILLIFLFNHNTQNLIISYYEPTETNISRSIKSMLNSEDTTLLKFNNEEKCVESVKKSLSNLCIIFPQNLSISEDFNDSLKLVIDQSKINIAYYLLDKINSELSVFTKSKQSEYISEILIAYNLSIENITKVLSKTEEVETSLSKIKNDIDHIRLLLSQMDTSSAVLDTSDLRYSAYDLINRYNHVMDLTKQTLSLFDDIYDDIDSLSTIYNFSEQDINLSNYKKNYRKLFYDFSEKDNTSAELTQPLIENVKLFSEEYDSSKSKLELIEQKKEVVETDLLRIESKVNQTLELLAYQKSLLTYTKRLYDSLPIKETHTLIEPIKTEIVPIFEATNEFVILPSILSLLIIFSSLLFSSSIVVSNNISRGRLREILSRKSKVYFYFSSFASSFLIVFIEMFAFLLLISFPLKFEINQFLALSFLLLISIPLFIFIGIFIGSLSSNKETAAFFSLIISVIFIILSGDLVPVEFFPKFIKESLPFLPYEMFKRASFSIIANQFNSIFAIFANLPHFSLLMLYTLIFFVFSFINFKQNVVKTKMLKFLLRESNQNKKLKKRPKNKFNSNKKAK